MSKCVICGQPSGFYPLCQYHNGLKEQGLVVKNDEGEWILKDQENHTCLICGKETFSNWLFCKDCYQEVKNKKQNFDHNRSKAQISSHYFELRDLLKTIKSKNDFNETIILMWALSEEFYDIHGQPYLKDRVKNDILHNTSKIQTFIQNNEGTTNFNDEDFRNKWPREYRCYDGHYVRSKAEQIIDDWLYNNGIIHAYEKSVFMESDPDAIVLCDFYLPQKDIYIEFWGLEDDEKYTKRKEEKIKLYDENKIKRIDLTEKDIKRIDDIMPRLLSKFKK